MRTGKVASEHGIDNVRNVWLPYHKFSKTALYTRTLLRRLSRRGFALRRAARRDPPTSIARRSSTARR